jgi:hypothetical protein
MKEFISFSGGVESTTMCVLFGNKADAIFADTGFEHKEIYERIELVESWCKYFHRADFKIHIIKPQMSYKGEIYTTLPDLIRAQKFYPNFQSRYCTRKAKIEPIDNFLEQFKEEGVCLYIGLNSDEIDQRTGNHGNKKFVIYSYPLAENGINRPVCINILKKVDLYPKFPPYMKRGGCKGCYFKTEKEYTAMALLSPIEFNEVEILESDIQDKKDKFFTILPKKSMKQIREDALSSLFNPDEIYPVINDATKCGVFCNR